MAVSVISNRAALRSLFVIQLLSMGAMEMSAPFWPQHLRALGHLTSHELALASGIAYAGPMWMAMCLTPWWGRLGDRIGHKPMLLRALLALAVTQLWIASADDTVTILVARLVQGALAGFIAAAQAYGACLVPSDKPDTHQQGRVLGVGNSAAKAGALFGAIAGSLILAWIPIHYAFWPVEVVVKEQADQGGSYEAIESAAATKIAVPLRDVPQAVNVVPKAVMRDQNALSVQDALQNVPGLSFSVGDGQRDQVTIRGFMAINDQFVDGVRDDALYFRDLSNIERVEVLKGPASVLYGRGSAGGLINRVTKKPSEKPIMEVGGTLGSQGQKRGEFDIGSTSSDKQTQFRLTGALEDSTGFLASTTVTLDHAFHSGLKLHSVLRGYNYSLDRNYTTINKVTANPTARVTIAQTRRLRDEDGYFFQNEISQKAQWGGTQHQILYGLELGQQHKSELLSSRNNAATYDLFNPVLVTLPPLPATIIPSADNKSRINIAALYLQDLVTLSPQWKVLGGLRYDQLRQKRDDRTARNVDLERTDNTLSPRLGAVYQPTEQVSLYTAYSRSFQPISDSFVFNANSDQFKPTQTQNKEVGIKLDIGAKASLTAALFDMSQTNIQVADPANPGFALPVGKQRTRGLELTFTGEIAPQWEMISGYSYMEGRITESTERTSAGTPFQGNTAALTPRHSLNLWVKRKFNDGYYVAAGGRAESARYASPDNLTVLPGYGVINLGAGHEEKKYDVAITLKNLFNRKYYVAAHSGANDYNMPGSAITWLHELDRMLNPDLFHIAPAPGVIADRPASITPVQVQDMFERLSTDPQYGIPTQITLAPHANEPLIAWYRTKPSHKDSPLALQTARQVMVNPLTLEISATVSVSEKKTNQAPIRGTPISPGQAMQAALAHYPHARVSRIALPAKPLMPYEIRVRQPGEIRQGDGATRLTIDAYSSQLLQ
eukprot:gene3239-3166_t